jgi:hypothetical protein
VAIPRHHPKPPTRPQHTNCLRSALGRILDEHQAVAIDHRVKAGIAKSIALYAKKDDVPGS